MYLFYIYMYMYIYTHMCVCVRVCVSPSLSRATLPPSMTHPPGARPPKHMIYAEIHHPGGNPGANLKSISHRCHPILVAFV